jgi:hypothetical protein
MLTRICLIVAIVAGLGALGISHFLVDKKIKGVIEQRDQNGKERDEARTAQKTAEDERDKTKKDLDSTTAELTTTKSQLEEKTKLYTEAESRATRVTTELAKANADKKLMLDELSPWRALLKTPDVVKTTLASHAKAVEDREIAVGENKILLTKVEKMQTRINELIGIDPPPVELPEGLKGKIVQVDPKYDFVVLDIGGNDGVKIGGELLINRKGRLIGKVRVTSFMPDKSIANILKAWKQAEPFEGDEVLY